MFLIQPRKVGVVFDTRKMPLSKMILLAGLATHLRSELHLVFSEFVLVKVEFGEVR